MPTDPDHIGFMQLALDLARRAGDRPGGNPFGAVVTIDGQIAGVGQNEVVARYDPTAHAEVMAIRDACFKRLQPRIPGAVIYASAEPCPLCLSAAMWAGITDVYFACSAEHAALRGYLDAEYYRQFTLPRDQRLIRSHRLLQPEGEKVMNEFKPR